VFRTVKKLIPLESPVDTRLDEQPQCEYQETLFALDGEWLGETSA